MQSKDECLFEGVGRYMRYSQAPFDPYGPAHVRNADPRQRRDYRERRQNARTLRYENDPPLCPDSRFVDPAGYADRCQKHGIVTSSAPLHPTRLVGISPGVKGRRQNKLLAQSPIIGRSAPGLFTKSHSLLGHFPSRNTSCR